MSVALFLLALGATLRITRFVTADYLAGSFRAWVMGWSGVDGKASYLVKCVACTSIWTSAGVFGALAVLGDSRWFVFPAAALTVSWVAIVAREWVEPD